MDNNFLNSTDLKKWCNYKHEEPNDLSKNINITSHSRDSAIITNNEYLKPADNLSFPSNTNLPATPVKSTDFSIELGDLFNKPITEDDVEKVTTHIGTGNIHKSYTVVHNKTKEQKESKFEIGEKDDPVQFIDGFIKIYDYMAKDENSKKQQISISVYAEKVKSILMGIKAGLEKCSYYIKPINIEGQELDISGFKLTKQQIGNTYILQPTMPTNLDELTYLSKIIQKQAQAGAFGKNTVMLMPFDVNMFEATLKE